MNPIVGHMHEMRRILIPFCISAVVLSSCASPRGRALPNVQVTARVVEVVEFRANWRTHQKVICHIESPPEFVGRMFEMMPQPSGSPANIPADWPPEVGSVITRPPADPRVVEFYGNGIIELLYPKIQDSATATGSVQQDE